MHEPSGYRNFDKQQILAIEAILAIPGIAAFLVLKHLWLLHLSPGCSEAAVLIVTLLWTTPGYLLLYRHASAASALAGQPSNDVVELQILRAVIGSLPDRIYVKDRQSKFILTNRSMREFFTGSPNTDINGKDDFFRFPNDIAGKFFRDEQTILSTGEPFSQSRWEVDCNGGQAWISTTKVPYRDENGLVVGTIGIGRDLTVQKRLEDSLVHAHEEMRYKATHDALTSLLNRGMILDLLQRELSRTRREQGSTALLIADVDNFKQVNDTLGHMVGDEVLREVARRLIEAVRSYDFVGRYGGEEFLLVLSNCDNYSPLERAEEIRKAICRSPIATSRGDLPVTISIGVLASSDWNSMSTEEMLRQADAALYAAKAAGRNCCHLTSAKPATESATPESQRSSVYDESCRTAAQPKKQLILTT